MTSLVIYIKSFSTPWIEKNGEFWKNGGFFMGEGFPFYPCGPKVLPLLTSQEATEQVEVSLPIIFPFTLRTKMSNSFLLSGKKLNGDSATILSPTPFLEQNAPPLLSSPCPWQKVKYRGNLSESELSSRVLKGQKLNVLSTAQCFCCLL